MALYKRALEICQYLMDLTTDRSHPSSETSSTNSKTLVITPLVDIETKSRLIEIWVQCKELLQQSIGRALGTDDPEIKTGQRPLIRATTAVQMLWVSLNELYRFPELPSVEDVNILYSSHRLIYKYFPLVFTNDCRMCMDKTKCAAASFTEVVLCDDERIRTESGEYFGKDLGKSNDSLPEHKHFRDSSEE